MQIIKAQPQATEPTLPLKDVTNGSIFRFAHDTFEDALKCDLFFMRIEWHETKGRVRVINLKDGKPLERDDDHRVIVHQGEFHIKS